MAGPNAVGEPQADIRVLVRPASASMSSQTAPGMELKASRQLPVRQKIILPFILLLIFVGVVGTAAATYRVTYDGMAALDPSLLRASALASDQLAALEANRLNDLRALVATPGLPVAVAAADTARLARLLAPAKSVAEHLQVVIRVVDGRGRLMLAIPPPSGQAAYGGLPLIKRVLAGIADARGDKYLELVQDASGPVVYWAAPIRDANDRVAGAMLLGESVANIALDVASAAGTSQAKLFFYGRTGQPLASHVASIGLQQSISSDRPLRLPVSINGHTYAVVVADWTMRGQWLGYLGVGLLADSVAGQAFKVRLILLLIFVGTALLVLLVGGLLARWITRPLESLVSSMRTVAAGNLSHRAPAGRSDEIGYLAASFNEMTASLEEKTRALEATYFASIEALARAIDARDEYTYGHSARVASLGFEIANAMGLPKEPLNALRRASLLHDIGKIGVEDRVLRKPGPLDEDEAEAIRRHPEIGYEMLKGLRFLEESLPGVLHHHERWDGTGYPDGLKGEDIPLAVRILTVADALDALTSARPYRAALSFPEALRAIEAGAGTQFDPGVVRVLLLRSRGIGALLKILGKPRTTPLEVFAEPVV